MPSTIHSVSAPMEMLCALSPHPQCILDLAESFDPPWSEQKVRDNIRVLRDKTFTVVVSKGKAWIPRAHWPRANLAALAYYERTYNL